MEGHVVEVNGTPTIGERLRAAAAACGEACREAEARTLAAQQAAERCAVARDIEAAAILVAKKAAAACVHDAAVSAAHRDARSAAQAAALAAREASFCCAAACREAMAAASAARESAGDDAGAAAVPIARAAAGGKAGAADVPAAREAAAGGDESEDVSAATKPREAARATANACFVALGDAATEKDRAAAAAAAAAECDVSVSRAYKAAAAALKAAACCDEALSALEPDDDQKFLSSMRGWLMTVAALLVNMTFTAIIKPPSWVPMEFGFSAIFHRMVASGDPLPAAAPSPGPAEDTVKSHPSVWVSPAAMSLVYLFLNTVTFAAAMTLVVALVKLQNCAAPKAMRQIRYMIRFLAVGAAGSFATGASDDMRVVGIVLAIVFAYALAVLRVVFRSSEKRLAHD